MLGILALSVSQRSPDDKISTKEFWWKDHKFYHCTRTFAWNCCLFTNLSHRLPRKLDKCWYFGSGKFEFGQWKVREKSGNFTFYNLWEPWKSASKSWIKEILIASLILKTIDHLNLKFLIFAGILQISRFHLKKFRILENLHFHPWKLLKKLW